MSRFFKGSVAAIALSAVIGLPLVSMAQDAAPAQETTQPAPAADLPPLLQSLNLDDVDIKDLRRGGKRIKGETAEGLEIRAFVDAAGNLRGIFADKDDDDAQAALPQAVIDEMIPEAVRGQDILGQIATISAIFSDERGVMVAGAGADGEDIRAGFATDGTLMRFGRGDDAMGPKGNWHNKGKSDGKADDRRDGRDRDGRFHRDHHRDRHGDRHDDRRGNHAERGPRGAGLSQERLNEALGAAGYTALGEVSREGPRTLVEATNPQGESVVVEVNPRGEVVRESAR